MRDDIKKQTAESAPELFKGTDRVHRLDMAKEKEKLAKKLADGGPESLTKTEMQILNSNRADRRRAGFKRQNVRKHRG